MADKKQPTQRRQITARQRGGSFAPPLSDDLLAKYRATIDGLDAGPVRDALDTLYKCCAQWWELPESSGDENGGRRAHTSGMGTIVPLDKKLAGDLYDAIPWTHELNAMGGYTTDRGQYVPGLFDDLTGDVRAAAFHLLWHVKELDLDREPITADQL